MRQHLMKAFIVTGLALGATSMAAPASARNYDCSKAGNANKAACKSSTTPAIAPKIAKTPAGTSKAVATARTTTTTKSTTSARNYDCTKPGNKTKAACKTAGPAVAPSAGVVKANKPAGVAATYDCTKFYNRMRAVCRTTGASTSAGASPALPASPAVATRTVTRVSTNTTRRSASNDASGATAQCKDGSFSHAKQHAGACSRHQGVAKWL